jgi:hypothetical protein
LENFWKVEDGWQTRREKILGIWWAIAAVPYEQLSM